MIPEMFARIAVRSLGIIWLLVALINAVGSISWIVQMNSGYEPGIGSAGFDYAFVLPGFMAAASLLILATSASIARWIATGAAGSSPFPQLVILLRLCGLAFVSAAAVMALVALMLPSEDLQLHDTYYVIANSAGGIYGLVQALVFAALGLSLMAGSKPIARWMEGQDRDFPKAQ